MALDEIQYLTIDDSLKDEYLISHDGKILWKVFIFRPGRHYARPQKHIVEYARYAYRLSIYMPQMLGYDLIFGYDEETEQYSDVNIHDQLFARIKSEYLSAELARELVV